MARGRQTCLDIFYKVLCRAVDGCAEGVLSSLVCCFLSRPVDLVNQIRHTDAGVVQRQPSAAVASCWLCTAMRANRNMRAHSIQITKQHIRY